MPKFCKKCKRFKAFEGEDLCKKCSHIRKGIIICFVCGNNPAIAGKDHCSSCKEWAKAIREQERIDSEAFEQLKKYGHLCRNKIVSHSIKKDYEEEEFREPECRV